VRENPNPESDMTSADAAPAPKAKPAGGPRDAVIEATMRLAAERGFADVTISDIARECSLSLADFRDLFPSKGAILGAFSRKIDRAVLDGTAAETFASEPARERLYEILHARLNALAPYRVALQTGPRMIRCPQPRSTARRSTPCASCWRRRISIARGRSAR
jgi:AcrR family transcriptional regulator